jgi:hypothetical protein
MTSCTYDMPRSACSVAFKTYHGASTIILRILDWRHQKGARRCMWNIIFRKKKGRWVCITCCTYERSKTKIVFLFLFPNANLTQNTRRRYEICSVFLSTYMVATVHSEVLQQCHWTRFESTFSTYVSKFKLNERHS